MTVQSTFIDRLISASQNVEVDVLIQEFKFGTALENQMLFFLKPEVFLQSTSVRTEVVCRFVGSRLRMFGFETAGCCLVSAATLKSKGIMDRHYGYINQMSRRASFVLNEPEKFEIQRLCGAPRDAAVIGGHEVLTQNPRLSAEQLDDIWATKKSRRLRSGLYFEKYEIDGQEIVVVNGFHPFQLEHFTLNDRKIALLLLNSALPWKMLRSRFLGDTFPEKAVSGSIRGEMHRDPAQFGFEAISIANNCAHMSAGPFEAVFELNNFLSQIPVVKFEIGATNQARLFRNSGLSDRDLERAIQNPVALVPATESSLFDTTEECDAISATNAYQAFFSRQPTR